jgi:hypothetical protein
MFLNEFGIFKIIILTLQTNKRITIMDLSDIKTLEDFQKEFLEIKSACEKEFVSVIKRVEIFDDNEVRIEFSNK